MVKLLIVVANLVLVELRTPRSACAGRTGRAGSTRAKFRFGWDDAISCALFSRALRAASVCEEREREKVVGTNNLRHVWLAYTDFRGDGSECVVRRLLGLRCEQGKV